MDISVSYSKLKPTEQAKENSFLWKYNMFSF